MTMRTDFLLLESHRKISGASGRSAGAAAMDRHVPSALADRRRCCRDLRGGRERLQNRSSLDKQRDDRLSACREWDTYAVPPSAWKRVRSGG